MESFKYVSDSFDIDKEVEKHGNRIFLIAGVGAGKSSWVKDVLTKKGTVLFITSRKAKVDEDVSISIFNREYKKYSMDNQTLFTNAKLDVLLKSISITNNQDDIDEFISHYDYIVIDEVHSIASDAAFAESAFGLFSFLEYAVKLNKVVIAMTGTPEPVENYFISSGWYKKDLRNVCRYVKPEYMAFIKKRHITKSIKECLENNWRVVYFVNRTNSISNVYDELFKENIIENNETAMIISKDSQEKNEDMLKKVFKDYYDNFVGTNDLAYKSIISKQIIPENIKVLITTSKLKEGIDINGKDIVVICDNHISTNIIQFCGRVRDGAKKVYIVEDSTDHFMNHDNLLYKYAVNEVIAANEFLESDVKNSPFEQAKIPKLCKHVSKNPYIYYNYIEQKFQIFDLKYKEEGRILECEDWKQKILDYCEEYKIRHQLELLNEKEIIYDAFLKLADSKEKLFKGERKEKLINILKNSLKTDKSSIRKLNEELKKQNVPIRIFSDKGNSGETRNKTYWQFFREEEYKRIAKK